MKASVNCHIIDYNIKGIRGPRNYSGTSPDVYFAIDQLKDLTPDDFPNGAITVPTVTEPVSIPPSNSETFNNMDSTFMSVTDNIIKQNMDKIQNLSDLDKVLNSINFENVLNLDNTLKFEDELLVKTYYVGFSILLILIILKLVFKKK